MRALSFCFALAYALLPARLNSCGWDWNAEAFRFWLLQPEIADSRALHAFYFTTETLYGPDYDAIVNLPYDANLTEWQAVVGNDVSADDIAMILYGTAPEDYFTQEAELFRTNAFMRRLAQKKKGWPAYISFAKRCEQLVNSDDPWGFIAHDGQGIRKAWKEGVHQLKAVKDPQLRARLAFQLVRLAHHSHDPGRPDLGAQALYDRYLAPLRGTTWMEPAAAFYLAGMLNNPQRDLAFADCFDRATDKQFRMVQLFASNDMTTYRIFAQNDKQRATLLVMRDLQHPGRALEDLERIAVHDPGNAHLPLLLCREANKLEDWLLTPALTDFNAAIRQWDQFEEGVTQEEVSRADRSYLHQVQDFITRIAPQYTGEQQALLQLLHGHLSFIVGDLDACRATMSRVEEDPAATAMMRAQARIDRILCGVMASKQLTDATRSDVLALVELMNTEPDLFGHRAALLGQLHLYLGKQLIERGEMAEGLFLLARTERMFGTMVPSWYSKNARHEAFEIAAPADYDRMIALLDKPNKTAFELYLTGTDERPADWENTEAHFKDNELSREKLLDYKATWYMVRDRLDEAAAAFKQIPDTFWTGYPYASFADDDPFQLNIHDPHNYGKTDVNRYNKRTIVERMIALKKEADRNPSKRALNHYLLGNAYFNMSWHGKYWIMSRIAWSIWEDGNWEEPSYVAGPFDDDYYGCARAKAHYLLGIKAAKDPVLKAMAVDMAGACERNWLAYSGDIDNDRTNPYRSALTDAKSEEAFRDIEECRGYAEFVGRYR